MRVFIIQFLFLFLPLIHALAQSTDTIYLSKNRKKIEFKADAAYFIVTSYTDAAQTEGSEKTFFITGEKESENSFIVDRTDAFTRRKYTGLSTKWYKSGQIKSQLNYSAGKLEGKHTQWYEDGQIYYVSNFADGKREGEAFTYYPGGKLKRKEVFTNDLLAEGKCFTKVGSDTVYFPMEELPEFPGGEAALLNFIKKNVKYNKKALKQGIKGLVVLQFVVDKFGNITDPEVVKRLSPELDAESLRVVNLMPGNWKPARQEGKPVSFRFTLPIRFSY